jgi:hypothetical protein
MGGRVGNALSASRPTPRTTLLHLLRGNQGENFSPDCSGTFTAKTYSICSCRGRLHDVVARGLRLQFRNLSDVNLILRRQHRVLFRSQFQFGSSLRLMIERFISTFHRHKAAMEAKHPPQQDEGRSRQPRSSWRDKILLLVGNPHVLSWRGNQNEALAYPRIETAFIEELSAAGLSKVRT